MLSGGLLSAINFLVNSFLKLVVEFKNTLKLLDRILLFNKHNNNDKL